MKKKLGDFKPLDPLELAEFQRTGNWCHSTERAMFDLLHSLPDIGSKRISIRNKQRTAMFALSAVREAFDDNDPRANPKGMRLGAASVGKTSFPPTTRRSGADKDPDETLH